jgi:hypothetical protein
MGADRARVGALAGASIILIVASVLVMNWFSASLDGLMGATGKLTFDLRSVSVCPDGGVCATIELSALPMLGRVGFYTSLGPIVFWTTLGFGAIVACQAAIKLLSDQANETLTKVGYGTGAIFGLLALSAGFVFTPNISPLTASRMLAPFVVVLGYAAGIAALYYIARDQSEMASALPVATVAPKSPTPIPTPRERSATAPPSNDSQRTGPVVPRTKSRPIPDPLKGQLRFTTLTADLSRAGIDARREDGSTLLVMWRDLVGVVARRLPPDEPYNGIGFVDLVSTAGSTLRILPWTRLSGDPVDGDGEGDARCRAVVQLVQARCPEIQLDRATKTFVVGGDPPAQLPDAATLAAHDQRLA